MPRRKKPPKKSLIAAIAISKTDNQKTGPVAATYASQSTCPVTCPLMGQGCYAETGPVGIITARLNAAGAGLTPVQIAVQEAVAIDRMAVGPDLRLHVVGDCRTDQAAGIVAAAATRYVERSRGLNAQCVAWTYTHSWPSVDRANWTGVSVLASCETMDGVDSAWDKGYACSIVVEEWENGTKAWAAYSQDGREYTVVPCPHQTRGLKCVHCRLCLDDAKLRENRVVIAFRAHGARRPTVVRRLAVLNGG